MSGRMAAREGVHIDEAVLLDVEVGHLVALAFKMAHRVEHGLVLGLHRDEVTALVLVEVRGALDGRLSLSVAPDVQTISRGSAPMRAAT